MHNPLRYPYCGRYSDTFWYYTSDTICRSSLVALWRGTVSALVCNDDATCRLDTVRITTRM